MREDRGDARGLQQRRKSFHLGNAELLAAPPRVVLQKNLDRVAADPRPAFEGLVNAAGNGHVSAQSWHALDCAAGTGYKKSMKKLLKWLGIGVVVFLVLLFLTLNLVARKAVEIGVKKVTGFPLEIGSLDFRLFTSKIDVRNIKLKNPSAYGDHNDPVFADLPELYIDYQLPSILKGKNHINDMRVELKEIVIVKKAGGDSNVGQLKKALFSGKGGTKYQIDLLRVKCAGQVVIKDYSRAKPSERRIPINVSAEYKNISDSTDITRLVLLTVMSQIHLPDIGIKPDELKKGLGEGVKGLGDSLDKAGKSLGDTLKQVFPGQNK